jgi:hypothetical protein
MNLWPRSRFGQGLIALVAALCVAIPVFVHVNNTHFDRYAKEYPHDGQDGLGALMDAFEIGAVTLVGVFLGTVAVQCAAIPSRRSMNPKI